jgi:hypothetical protein
MTAIPCISLTIPNKNTKGRAIVVSNRKVIEEGTVVELNNKNRGSSITAFVTEIVADETCRVKTGIPFIRLKKHTCIFRFDVLQKVEK